jgi:hypothetical protein
VRALAPIFSSFPETKPSRPYNRSGLRSQLSHPREPREEAMEQGDYAPERGDPEKFSR